MKVAKNMDSVFANCTDDELEFDIFFDDDETIIDVLAGVDEAGNLITDTFCEADEEDVEDDSTDDEAPVDEADDMVGEKPDFDYQKDGDASGSEKDAEGTKEVKPEIGGEVGTDTKLANQNSAESNADDTKDEEEAIGMNDKQQVKLEDAAEGPLEDDDEAEREGKVSDTAVETESVELNDEFLAMLEADEAEEQPAEDDKPADDVESESCKEATDPIADPKCPNDGDVRDGSTKFDSKNTEGEDTEVLGASIVGDVNKDVLVDLDDEEQRNGKAEGNDVEGVKTHVVGAALEASDNPTPGDDPNSSANNPATDTDVKPEEQEGDPGSTNESVELNDEFLAMLEADEAEEQPAEDDKPADDAESESCKEATDPIADECDACEREGKAKHDTSNTEGEDTEVLGASIVGDVNKDVLVDLDDEEQRNGKAEGNDVEGVKTHVVGAALEASDFIDDLLDSLDDDDDLIDIVKDTDTVVPDKVTTDGTDNVDIKAEAAKVDEEELVDGEDDDDIEAIDSEKLPKGKDYDYDYDDDELIDAVINGDIDKLPDVE